MKHKNAVLVLSFIILLTSCGGKHVLFSEGYSEYCIVIDKDAAASEQYAATELRDWIKEVSGATLPIKDITEGEPGRRLIVGYNSLVSEMNPGSEKPDSSDDSEGQAMKIHMITPGGYEGPLPTDRLFIP